MAVLDIVFNRISKIVKDDRKIIIDLVYYSLIEAILVLSIPMASAFVINSVLSHADISVYVLGIVVITLFIIITFMQILQAYIVEKFQQKIFVTTAIDISMQVTDPSSSRHDRKNDFIKNMNYFFDITSIQKFFPILLLDGVGIVLKVIVSLILLWFFDPYLFVAGILFFGIYLTLILLLGGHGPGKAIERSDAKHDAIYYMQNIDHGDSTREELLKKLDQKLSRYALTRQALFEIIIRQLALTYIAEGIVFVGFMLIGGYLVVEGTLPVGEFIAAEIVVVSIIYALKSFVKQLDYIYDTTEGFYKIDKLSKSLGDSK